MMTTSGLQRYQLGLALRSYRLAAGTTQRDVAEAMEWSVSKLVRIENGKNGASAADTRRLLEHYGQTDAGTAEELVALAVGGRRRRRNSDRKHLPPSVAKYQELELAAETIWNYEPMFVPGLLQTDAYAAELISAVHWQRMGGEELQAILAVRAERRAATLDRPAPWQFNAFVDESVLRRRVGGPDVLLEQLAHLATTARRPGVTIRALPLTAGVYPGMLAPFSVFRLPGGGQALFLENIAENVVVEGRRTAGPDAETYLGVVAEMESRALDPAATLDLIEDTAAQCRSVA